MKRMLVDETLQKNASSSRVLKLAESQIERFTILESHHLNCALSKTKSRDLFSLDTYSLLIDILTNNQVDTNTLIIANTSNT